ncbi:TonB-dependent receptor [Pedobacter heparinus]|uniref:TonB-dependent receptor n=1 Tax=Pedobacter heparinus (strain ATCC 13125 / DSM 2366 / CIP 104194 / JCM 7457 / NBRC 12017 / NCIMB 9290 / NRRL B-14731 / HIM 762-3) TaxID=485917 RepID=C6XW47_PEDHD|nr:TonB-dependent receptor [Pedobacter heparinus]ACU04126.1 TonB-dependent receptor [Pedobacter heparinus DSM 2366]
MIRKSSAIRGMNCRFSVFFKAILWLGIFMPLTLFAQEDVVKAKKADSIDKVNQLKEVQIRTIKIGRRQTSSTPLQILSGEELQRLNSLSVADAVRYFSGVQLKDYGGIGGLKTINVRSMGTNHTAVFYDGVQLGNAQNGQVDLGKFSLDNIAEIELYNGQKSTIFQSAKGFAAGSSLYINSTQPDFEDGRSDKWKATLKGGSFGLIDPSVLWQHKISESIYSSLSAEWKKASGRYKFRVRNYGYDTTAVREDGGIETMRLELGLNGVLPDSSLWTVKLYGYNDKQGLPGAIVNNVWRFPQRMWNRNFFAQSTFKKDLHKYHLLAAVKYANDYTKYLDPNYVKDTGFLTNIYKQQELYFSLANRYQLSSFWDIVLSGDYQWNTLDANMDRFPYPTRYTGLLALATEIHLDRLNIQANLLGTLVNDEVERYFSAGNKRELKPSVMVSWQPFSLKEFRLRGFYKDIFRMPTFNDLYYTLLGNTFLKPEYAKQYDLGFTYIRLIDNHLLNQISIQSDVYYNKIRNKIVAVPGANLFTWSMQNLGLVEIRGLDVNIQTGWRIADQLMVNTGITYTYQKALNMTDVNLNYKNQIPYIPVHSGSFTAGADWRNLGLNYSYIYTGERYDQSANIIENYVQPWYTHDIAFHYHKDLKHARVKVSVEVNNLLNQDYEVVTNFPMPGRSYRFTLSYAY